MASIVFADGSRLSPQLASPRLTDQLGSKAANVSSEPPGAAAPMEQMADR